MRSNPTLAAIVLGVVLLSTSACATTAPEPVRTYLSPDEARSRFGTIAVVAVKGTLRTSFGPPGMSRAEAAGKGASVGGGGPIVLGILTGHPLGVIGGIMLSPLTAIAGTVYGMVAAPSSEDVKNATRALAEAASANTEEKVRDLVIARLTDGRYPVAASVGESEDGQAADTVVEVSIFDVTLGGQGVFDATLDFVISGSARIVTNDVESRFVPLVNASRGRGHTLTAWARDDARLFKEQINRSLEALADDTVYELLRGSIDDGQH